MIESELGKIFPNLGANDYEVKSPQAKEYNCIAWAAGVSNRKWWPKLHYWPVVEETEESVEAFVRVFAKLGYEPCSSSNFEEGFEKVAIYADENNRTKHMARQLASGSWTSKLGSEVDIEHTLDGLTGREYGHVARILKRPKNVARKMI